MRRTVVASKPGGSQPQTGGGAPGAGDQRKARRRAASDLDAGVAHAGGRLDAAEAEGAGEAGLALVLVLPVVADARQEAAEAGGPRLVPGLVFLDEVALDAVQVVVAEVLVD